MTHPAPNEEELRIARLSRFRLMMKRMTLLSLLAAVIAVAVVAQGDTSPRIHLLIATALGVFGTMMLGTFLMTLSFFSSSSGHDEAATKIDPTKE